LRFIKVSRGAIGAQAAGGKGLPEGRWVAKSKFPPRHLFVQLSGRRKNSHRTGPGKTNSETKTPCVGTNFRQSCRSRAGFWSESSLTPQLFRSGAAVA